MGLYCLPVKTVSAIRVQVEAKAARVAELGGWPSYISHDSLLARVPTPELRATGFDAGIACALDLIPRDRQRLASSLHAAYTPAVVAQARREAAQLLRGLGDLLVARRLSCL